MPSGSAVQMAVRRPTHGPAEPWADDMSPKREVVDLDEHDHQPTESSHTTPDDHLIARRKMNVRLIAAFVIGAALGGVAVSDLRDSREERNRNASVSLVAFPAASGSGGSDATGIFQMDGQLAVINAGPAPITVHASTGQRPGVDVRDTGQSRLLRDSDCRRRSAGLEVHLAATTADRLRPRRAPQPTHPTGAGNWRPDLLATAAQTKKGAPDPTMASSLSPSARSAVYWHT
jgi:hypothetical protein